MQQCWAGQLLQFVDFVAIFHLECSGFKRCSPTRVRRVIHVRVNASDHVSAGTCGHSGQRISFPSIHSQMSSDVANVSVELVHAVEKHLNPMFDGALSSHFDCSQASLSFLSPLLPQKVSYQESRHVKAFEVYGWALILIY